MPLCCRSHDRVDTSDIDSEDDSIRTGTRLTKPQAWARFGVQVVFASTILVVSLALIVYDVGMNGKPTEITTVMLPVVTFIVGLFFNSKNNPAKSETAQAPSLPPAYVRESV